MLKSIGALVLVISGLGPLRAQTVDESRLTVGITFGSISGAPLWSIERQPIVSTTTVPDIFSLQRQLRRNITVGGGFTYFPKSHFGIAGEFAYLGLRQADACTLVEHHGDPTLATACDSVAAKHRSAATTIVQGGVIYRPLSHSVLQPYVKATAGLAFVPANTASLASVYWHQLRQGVVNPEEIDSIITIYRDSDWEPIRMSWVVAAGIATAPTSGIQIKIELRQSWIPLAHVAEPTTGQGFVPATKTVVTRFTSIVAGFEIVFAKQRGRRY